MTRVAEGSEPVTVHKGRQQVLLAAACGWGGPTGVDRLGFQLLCW